MKWITKLWRVLRIKPVLCTDEELELLSALFSKLEISCAWIVVVGVLLELPILTAPIWWSGSIPTLIIAIGICGEIVSSSIERAANGRVIERLKIGVSEARTREVEAQTKLKETEAQSEIALHRAMSRYIRNHEDFAKALEGKPKAEVEIAYKAEDDESYFLSLQIKGALIRSEWVVTQIREIIEADSAYPSPDRDKQAVPLSVRSTAMMGDVAFRVKRSPSVDELFEARTPIGALQRALNNSNIKAGLIQIWSNMPEDRILILVVPRLQGI